MMFMCSVCFRHGDILFMLNMCTGEMSAASRGLSPHYTAQHTQHTAVEGTAAHTDYWSVNCTISRWWKRTEHIYWSYIKCGMMKSHKVVLMMQLYFLYRMISIIMYMVSLWTLWCWPRLASSLMAGSGVALRLHEFRESQDTRQLDGPTGFTAKWVSSTSKLNPLDCHNPPTKAVW